MHRTRTGRAACGALLAAAALTAAACSSAGPGPPPDTSGTATPAGTHPSDARTDTTTGVFLEPELASNAFTYNVERVPPNSTATVTVARRGPQTQVSLNVSGLQPGRGYGAAALTHPCAADPAAAGHVYQDETDPAGPPSRDPQYANPENELRLGFTTTASGTAHSTSTVGWNFRSGEARSLVLFAHPASDNADDAGDAGARLACLDVDF